MISFFKLSFFVFSFFFFFKRSNVTFHNIMLHLINSSPKISNIGLHWPIMKSRNSWVQSRFHFLISYFSHSFWGFVFCILCLSIQYILHLHTLCNDWVAVFFVLHYQLNQGDANHINHAVVHTLLQSYCKTFYTRHCETYGSRSDSRIVGLMDLGG